MLGMDWLLATKRSLDFQGLELKVNGERIRCTGLTGSSFVGRVVVAEATVIPAGHEVVVVGTIVDKHEGLRGPVIIEPIDGGGRLGEQGLVLAKALINVPAEVVPIRVLNTSKDKRVLRAGTTVKLESSPTNKGKHGTCVNVLPSHLQNLFDRSRENLYPSNHVKLRGCLIEFQDVFNIYG